jgi:hypothetical protein
MFHRSGYLAGEQAERFSLQVAGTFRACYRDRSYRVRRSGAESLHDPSAPNPTGSEGIMTRENSVVCIYNTHSDADAAVKTLQVSGFEMKQLSIVGKDYHTEEHVIGFYNAGDRMKYWGKLGAFWGGIWGFFVGAAFFWIPGIGPLVVAGPLVSWIVGALEGAVVVGGFSALGGALYSIGIPKDSIVRYETAIKSGKFLLLAHGTMAEVSRAREILEPSGPAETNVHPA